MGRNANYGFLDAVGRSGGIVLLLLLIEFADQLLGLELERFGILPRRAIGLAGVAFSPLLHGGFAHLTANVGPLFVLLIILFWNHRYYPERSLFLIWLLSGIGTWLIGRGFTIHIGASSIVFGLVSYLIIAAFWMQCWRALFFSVLVFLFFGGIFYGLFQIERGVSWEGHLSGAIAGFWAAWINHRR
ncbi:MAG: hypothetical protein M2R45_04664 [Verrucomicrobia subdivision 3 bacterium]|nr:hypothetical protein [Limisphaerales bacterium]MCS1416586.1 hypothetical protein [Limisphaerales bacterium]